MYFLLIILQAILMNWFIAKIVFGITAENKKTQQFDEQLRLIAAETPEEAFLKSRTIGLREEDSFLNNNNEKVKWEFINVAELIPLKKIEDGMEVYSRIHEIEEARGYVHYIHQKAISLRMKSMPLF